MDRRERGGGEERSGGGGEGGGGGGDGREDNNNFNSLKLQKNNLDEDTTAIGADTVGCTVVMS